MYNNLNKDKIIITGSEGVVGSEISKYLEKFYDVIKLSLSLGHDLSDEEFVKDYFSKNKAQYIVNCFGYNDHVNSLKNKETLFDVSLESLNKYLSLNVVSLFSVCREFSKNDEAKGIVNLSSVYSLVSPNPTIYLNTEKHIGYSVSKAAVNHLTKHLAIHLAPRIRVNCIVLGGVENEDIQPEFEDNYNKNVPIGRLMKGNEIVGIIEYLCSSKSTYTTGSIITIDGGWTSW